MQKCRAALKSFFFLFFIATYFVVLTSAHAGPRCFTYVYEATTAAPGSVESENWITWKTSPRDNRRFNSVDFRNEIEFGIDRLQAAIYPGLGLGIDL